MRSICLITLLFLAHFNCVSCYYNDQEESIFSTLRRTDHSGEKTYHFSRVTQYAPINGPVIYEDGYGDNSKMIVGFNNMLIFGKYENEKHFVIRVNEDLDEDTEPIPSHFLNDDSGELFDVVTLKPTTTTTTTTQFPQFRDMVKDAQREALPGFDPDTQSLSGYLQQVALNASRLYQSPVESEEED